MRKTERSGVAPENVFSEITTGDAPSSIEVTRNARGDYQWSIKVYMQDSQTLKVYGTEVLRGIDAQLRERFLPAQEGK